MSGFREREDGRSGARDPRGDSTRLPRPPRRCLVDPEDWCVRGAIRLECAKIVAPEDKLEGGFDPRPNRSEVDSFQARLRRRPRTRRDAAIARAGSTPGGTCTLTPNSSGRGSTVAVARRASPKAAPWPVAIAFTIVPAPKQVAWAFIGAPPSPRGASVRPEGPAPSTVRTIARPDARASRDQTWSASRAAGPRP